MKILRDPAAVAGIADAFIRQLLAQHFTEMAQDGSWDTDQLGYFVVVEPGDSLEMLERQTGCSITKGRFSSARFGDSDFWPSWEYLEEHPSCYDLGFVLSDSGFGIGLVVPKLTGIDAQLLALCQAYAVPAGELIGVANDVAKDSHDQ
jgi:hypothetical protein